MFKQTNYYTSIPTQRKKNCPKKTSKKNVVNGIFLVAARLVIELAERKLFVSTTKVDEERRKR